MNNTYAHISILKFKSIKEHLPQFVLDQWTNQEFKGFHAGVVLETEKYKYDLRYQFIEILNVDQWTEETIGSGVIAQALMDCFELKENNLLGNKKGVGEKSLSHYKLIQAIDNNDVKQVEWVAFKLFKLGQDNETTFNELIAFFGKKYSLLALLYFIYNDKKYLPISTSNFEHAFRLLGNDSALQRKCSWENYSNYLQVIEEVKLVIELEFNENINLLDAHSFCWMIGYNNRYEKWLESSEVSTDDTLYKSFEITTQSKPKKEKELQVPHLDQKDKLVDWDQKNKNNRLKGLLAEQHVRIYEAKRLTKEGHPELAKRVEDFSNKLGQGFDVLSFNADGSHRKIEVKATEGNHFMITSNEFNLSEQENYWIYLVTVKDSEVLIRKISSPELNNPEKFTLTPKNYRVSFKAE